MNAKGNPKIKQRKITTYIYRNQDDGEIKKQGYSGPNGEK